DKLNALRQTSFASSPSRPRRPYPSMSAVPPIASEGLSGLAQLTERRRTCRRKRCSELASPLVSSRGVSSQLNTSGRYFAPRRAGMPCVLSLLHSFRFIGLAFLVKGVVAPGLPAAFAVPAAYGDLTAAVLALVALAALRSGFGIPLVWVFNLWGSADLLNAFYQANASGLEAGMLQATYFIPTFILPLLLITHVLVFLILIRRDSVAAAQ